MMVIEKRNRKKGGVGFSGDEVRDHHGTAEITGKQNTREDIAYSAANQERKLSAKS